MEIQMVNVKLCKTGSPSSELGVRGSGTVYTTYKNVVANP